MTTSTRIADVEKPVSPAEATIHSSESTPQSVKSASPSVKSSHLAEPTSHLAKPAFQLTKSSSRSAKSLKPPVLCSSANSTIPLNLAKGVKKPKWKLRAELEKRAELDNQLSKLSRDLETLKSEFETFKRVKTEQNLAEEMQALFEKHERKTSLALNEYSSRLQEMERKAANDKIKTHSSSVNLDLDHSATVNAKNRLSGKCEGGKNTDSDSLGAIKKRLSDCIEEQMTARVKTVVEEELANGIRGYLAKKGL